MRLIEKTSKEVKTCKYGVKALLIFRSNSKFHGFIEYTATRKLPSGKVYRVDKAIYNQDGNHIAYYPKTKPMFNTKF